MKLVVRNIRTPITVTEREVMEQAEKRLAPLLGKKDITGIHIYRRSVDTRRRNITFVWSVAVDTDRTLSEGELSLCDSAPLPESDPLDGLERGTELLEDRPVVVGFGPCGMFCALLLAEYGYRPIVIERGEDIEPREKAVEKFLSEQILDENSNIQFGAGGAGTFSDGKLVTRINDKKCSYVLKTMVELGAPAHILYEAKPHIGTDILKTVVTNMRKKLESLGTDIYFNTKFTGFSTSCGKVTKISTTKGDFECSALILALGHSARDTFAMLMKKELSFVPKAFSVGVRIEHLQNEIDKGLYGDNAGDPLLPKGEYNLSHREGERGVYTFCMCPGGTVIAAASEQGGVVTNGMSRYARDGKNANAAVAVSVLPSDFGGSAQNAIEFQRELEKKAFAIGGSNYHAPAETVGDFLGTFKGTEPSLVSPTYMDGKVKITDMGALLPSFVAEFLKKGLSDFGRKLPGFDMPYAMLTGIESRTSSPIRIMRNSDYTAFGYDNIYPCGEGAGYAGGITSAAVDGLNCALGIMAKYKHE